eukprot:CAMPEP_0170183616 /NCGR_PEP_ID=MMETSP0040_2-20121228/31256_1 /TAXON_ID=641309 /ORGANISM="Lotharella oceanica, Strain CCMP622" /LENGTH=40 /DNA_ID= /DNA_START= /DNA_END= /DNA_ORIENTATION=
MTSIKREKKAPTLSSMSANVISGQMLDVDDGEEEEGDISL